MRSCFGRLALAVRHNQSKLCLLALTGNVKTERVTVKLRIASSNRLPILIVPTLCTYVTDPRVRRDIGVRLLLYRAVRWPVNVFGVMLILRVLCLMAVTHAATLVECNASALSNVVSFSVILLFRNSFVALLA